MTNKMNCELMLTYDTPALRQSGSRNVCVLFYFFILFYLLSFFFISLILYLFFYLLSYFIYLSWSRNLTSQKTLVTKYPISAINSCWEKCDEKCAYMFNVYKNQLSRQTGSRNLTGPKMHSTNELSKFYRLLLLQKMASFE
jgi:hypothetical protein